MVKIWDFLNGYGELKSLNAHSDKIRWLALTNDGSKIFTGSYDDKAKLWDIYDDYSLIETFTEAVDDVEKV